MEFLASFRPHIVYRPGKGNPADPLSRLCVVAHSLRAAGGTSRVRGRSQKACAIAPLSEEGIATSGEGSQIQLPFDVELCKAAYAIDPTYQGESLAKLLADKKSTFRCHDGLYFQEDRLAIPHSLQKDVIRDCHETPCMGHMGITKTLDMVRRRFWWPTWRQDVTEYVRSCRSCQYNKPLTGKPHGPLQPLPIPQEPWESVSIDFMVELPRTTRGNDTLMVFVDRLTKMVHLVPTTKDYSAEMCAEAFMEHVFRLHGVPAEFVTDRDKVWTSAYHKELCHCLDIRRSLTTAYHPESDGQVERYNRVIQEVLRHFVTPRATNWDKLLPTVEFALNIHRQESTGYSPFQLNFGRNPSSPLDREFDEICPRKVYYRTIDKCATAQEFHNQWRKLLKDAKDHISRAQNRQKAFADSKRAEVPEGIAVGKEVLLSTRHLRMNIAGCPKFMPRYIGPFIVTEEINRVAYRLELPDPLKVHNVFHVSLLKPWIEGGRYTPPPPVVFVDG